MWKAALQLVTCAAFLFVVTPIAAFAWVSGLPGMGSLGWQRATMLVAIPLVWLTLACALVWWIGLPLPLILGGLGAFTLYATFQHLVSRAKGRSAAGAVGEDADP